MLKGDKDKEKPVGILMLIFMSMLSFTHSFAHFYIIVNRVHFTKGTNVVQSYFLYSLKWSSVQIITD